jgi:hypothetical protein
MTRTYGMANMKQPHMSFVTEVLGEIRFCHLGLSSDYQDFFKLSTMFHLKHRTARGLSLGREFTRNVVIQSQRRKSPVWANDGMES